jgi:hypothetical protein
VITWQHNELALLHFELRPAALQRKESGKMEKRKNGKMEKPFEREICLVHNENFNDPFLLCYLFFWYCFHWRVCDRFWRLELLVPAQSPVRISESNANVSARQCGTEPVKLNVSFLRCLFEQFRSRRCINLIACDAVGFHFDCER